MAIVFDGYGGSNVQAAATSTASPQSFVGSLMIVDVVGTPSANYAPHTVTMPAGWNLIGERTQDVTGLVTDLYLGLWWKIYQAGDGDPLVTVSQGFYSDQARWQARVMGFSGWAATPSTVNVVSAASASTPYTLPSITLANKSGVVSYLALRDANAAQTQVANSFTRTPIFESSSPMLSSSLVQWHKSDVSAGAVTMPTVQMPANIALVGITFDLPQVAADEWGMGCIRW